MAKQIVNVGTTPNDKTGDPIRTAFEKINEVTEDVYPIVGSAGYKTVGVGKDFETLVDAFLWARNKLVGGTGYFYFVLDDGMHYLTTAGNYLGAGWTFKNSGYFYITSAGGNADNCILTMHPDTGTHTNKTGKLFYMTNCLFITNNITFDPLAGGQTELSIKYRFGKDSWNNTFLFYNTKFKNLIEGVYCGVNTHVLLNDCSFDSCETAILADNISGVLNTGGTSLTITNCTKGIDNIYAGRIVIDGVNTFTGNTEDTNIPLNEIQYDGSIISDGTSELTHKGHPTYIDSDVTYTVAADGTAPGTHDFDDFETAVRFLTTITTTKGNPRIILELEDGQHLIQSKYSDFTQTMSIRGLDFEITSASSDKTLCTITLAPDALDTYYWFSFCHNGTTSITDITIDPTLNGNTGAWILSFFTATSNHHDYYNNVVVNHTDGLACFDLSSMSVNNTEIYNCRNSGVAVRRMSFIEFGGTNIIDNCRRGVYIESKSHGHVFSSGSLDVRNNDITGIRLFESTFVASGTLTFSGNAEDSNIPLNEIQHDGTYIDDGSGTVLKHKDNITEDTTFTVGSGKDFTTIDDALRYLVDTAEISPTVEVTLSVDDGTHELIFPDGESYAYNLAGINIIIESASGTKSACVLTLPATFSGAGFVFFIERGSLNLNDITFDGTLNGATATLVWFLYYIKSTGSVGNVDIKNCREGLTAQNQSYVVVGGGAGANNIFTNCSNNAIISTHNSMVLLENPVTIDACAYGLVSRFDSTIQQSSAGNLTITNNTTVALYAKDSAKVVTGSATVTLTGNTSDYYIPVNEIQYDGSYITNSASALSFKA